MPAPGKSLPTGTALPPVDQGKGWLGDLQTKEVMPSISFTRQKGEAVWLPDEVSAKLWQDFISAK